MAFEREVTVRGRRYRQLVESRWDPKKKCSVPHVLRHLGPVHPRYPRPSPDLPTTTTPVEPLDAAFLATRMAQQDLSVHEVLEVARRLSPSLPLPEDRLLQAVGIRYELGKETAQLLLWTSSPSAPSPRARRAGRPAATAASTRRPSSRSKDA